MQACAQLGLRLAQVGATTEQEALIEHARMTCPKANAALSYSLLHRMQCWNWS